MFDATHDLVLFPSRRQLFRWGLVRSAAVAFLLSTVVAAVLTPLVRAAALRLNLVDGNVGSRKIHARPIPRLGGIAIIAGFYAPLVALFFFESSVGQTFYARQRPAVALLIAGAVIGLLGVYDDIRGANAKKKFAVQFGLAIFLWFGGYRIDRLATPFGFSLPLGWAALPFTMLWIVGVINALNLIDGMDGLAGGVAMFALTTTFIIALLRPDPLMMLFMASLGGGVLGFLFYNFNPASIFMGDSGSMFLGLILAVTSIQTSQKSSTAVAILVPIIILGLPIADTLLAMARRALQGRPLFSADKEHIHHRLLALGFSQRHAMLVLYAACIVLASAALFLVFASSRQAVVILVALTVGFMVAMRLLGFLHLEHHARVTERRRRNLRLRSRIRALARTLPAARDAGEVWAAIQDVCGDLEVAAMTLTLVVAQGPDETTHRFSRGEGDVHHFQSTFPLQRDGASVGHLDFWWADGRTEISRDDEIAIEVLCDHVVNVWAEHMGGTSPESQTRLKLIKG